jgi:hypothetical protein
MAAVTGPIGTAAGATRGAAKPPESANPPYPPLKRFPALTYVMTTARTTNCFTQIEFVKNGFIHKVK